MHKRNSEKVIKIAQSDVFTCADSVVVAVLSEEKQRDLCRRLFRMYLFGIY